MNEEDEKQIIPEARERHSRWPGWIWSVPIAAFLIVGYLAVRQTTSHGPAVKVTFATAGGIKPSDTQVQYQGLQVGEVDSVTLQKDLRHVDVVLHLHSDMEGHLGPGTRFWIAGKPKLTDLSSIRTVIAGPYIGVDPRPGAKQEHYDGLSEPPAVEEDVAGTHYLLSTEALGTITRDSPIYYHDLQVGTVESTHLEQDGRHFIINTFVRSPFNRLVHDNSHFWNAGAVQLSMSGSGPRLQMQSLPALFGGAVAFDTPNTEAAGGTAEDGASFALYDSKSAAANAPGAMSVRYGVTFGAAEIGELDVGSPVRLANQLVGSVRSSSLEYDPRSGELISHVIIEIDPTHFTLSNGGHWASNARPQLNDLLRHLIDQGLRARLGKTMPVVGGDAVLLDFVPQAAPARLGSGDVPELPTAPRSDIQGLVASLGGVGAKLNAIPIDQIANDIRETTDKLAELSQSKEVKDSLQHLDETLSSVDAVAHVANQQVGPILVRLREVANETDATVALARNLIASKGDVSNQPETTGIGNALYELSRSARALRELADFLDQHPEALLRGRDEGR